MNIKAFMIANSPAIKELVAKITKGEFDSHELIKLFMKRFEPEYIGFLVKYPKHSHRIVNSQIARSLYTMKDLNIQKTTRVKSESVFGHAIDNQKWQVG